MITVGEDSSLIKYRNAQVGGASYVPYEISVPTQLCFSWKIINLYSVAVRPCKVKLSLCLSNWALCHEGIWGSGYIDPHFLNLSTSWKWVVSFPLYLLGKGLWYPLDRRLGGPQSQSGWHGEEKILDPTRAQTLTPGHPACSLSLYWRYPDSLGKTLY
jgi:hypothetical protein